MGMSTHITGLRNPGSKKHQAMLTAVQALHNAEIYDLPTELQEYFKGYYETTEIVDDPYAGAEVNIDKSVKKKRDRECCDDWIVELKSLPEGVTHIRFTNSY